MAEVLEVDSAGSAQVQERGPLAVWARGVPAVPVAGAVVVWEGEEVVAAVAVAGETPRPWG